MKKLIKLLKDKELNYLNQINDFIDPTCIYLPKDNNYQVNDYIYKNTFINNIPSSISGKIAKIEKRKFNNEDIFCYQIINDFKENAKNKIRKKSPKNKEELMNYLDLFHLTEIINKINEKGNLNNIVVCAVDEECYSFNEFISLSNYYNEIITTLNHLLEICVINNGFIATKNTDSGSIKKVKSILGTYPNIKMKLLPDLYLISYEEYLCSYLNIKKEETLIFNTNEILILYNALFKNRVLNEKIITISGNNIAKSLIIKTRIGTPLKEIIDKFIEIKDNNYNIFINGIYVGYQVTSFSDVIISPSIHTIIINKLVIEEETECLNCGACFKICPVNINVKKCYFEKMLSKKCLGCGLCNYICPANLKLKEVIKDGAYEEKNN